MPPKRRPASERPTLNPLPTDILLTLDELGIEVTKVAGDEAHALCPSPTHWERTPSWSINLTTGEHNCFSCGWGGKYWYLVKVRKNFEEFEDVEKWIRKRGGIGVARKKLHGEQGFTKKEADEVSEAQMALFDTEIPLSALRDKDIIQEAAEAYDVRWDAKRKMWITPVRDPFTNELLGWQEKNKHHFRNVPDAVEKSRALFGYHLLDGLDVAYLEESPLDCPRLWTYNIDGAISGYGVHVSDFQMDLICDSVKTLFVCLDNDRAGRKKSDHIWRTYRHQVRLMFANYEDIEEKDHGDMRPKDIEYSLDHAFSALRYRPYYADR